MIEVGGDRMAVLDMQLQTIQSLKGQLFEKEKQFAQIQADYEKMMITCKRDE
jgi:hypothetical protein